jgi:hypothetical protein
MVEAGQVLLGPLFSEPMRVVTVSAAGAGRWVLGLVGAQSERFRSVTLGEADLETLTILGGGYAFDSDAKLLRLGLQAYSLGNEWEFDPDSGSRSVGGTADTQQVRELHLLCSGFRRSRGWTPARWFGSLRWLKAEPAHGPARLP